MKYQRYLIAREHNPSTGKRQFSEVRNKARAEARTKQIKQDKVSDVKFITTYNPALTNTNKIIYLLFTMMKTWRSSLTIICKGAKSLKETLSPSLFPPKFNKNESSISNCNKCNSAKIILNLIINLSIRLLGRVCCVRGSLSCNSPNVVYIIPCKNCTDQYVGSATDFKARFRIGKSRRKIGVVLSDILTTNVVIVAILTYFSKCS